MTEEICCEFKVGDRVRQKDVSGPTGTVKSIRVETTRETLKQDDSEPKSLTVTVLWDNGTLSHFIPDGLTK